MCTSRGLDDARRLCEPSEAGSVDLVVLRDEGRNTSADIWRCPVAEPRPESGSHYCASLWTMMPMRLLLVIGAVAQAAELEIQIQQSGSLGRYLPGLYLIGDIRALYVRACPVKMLGGSASGPISGDERR